MNLKKINKKAATAKRMK